MNIFVESYKVQKLLMEHFVTFLFSLEAFTIAQNMRYPKGDFF